MLFSTFVRPGLLPALLSKGLLAAAAPAPHNDLPPDPCIEIAGLSFVDPVDVIACQKSFPFDEDLRQNVLDVVSRVFDFYTFEDFYLNSPPPFQESTTDIRAEIARINSTEYATDYDFNLDLWDFTNRLNDGHTSWFPFCYFSTYQNILPAPVVLLGADVFIAPDTDVLFDQLGQEFEDFFTARGFDWRRLAGSEVVEIEGMPPRQYIDKVARTDSGNFLDHNVRVNSVVSSYQMPQANGSISQRLGDLAFSNVIRQTRLNFSLIPMDSNSSEPEFIDVPFVAAFNGQTFVDGISYWANNCVATNKTNGVDRKRVPSSTEHLARAQLLNPAAGSPSGLNLPSLFLPTLPQSDGSTGIMKTFILPGNNTGVMFIGTFEGNSQFLDDVAVALDKFNSSGVKNIIIDVTNNGGGIICLGLFLHQFLAGTEIGLPGFQTTSRANPLAQKILKADITQGLNRSVARYSADNWLFLNGTQMPVDFDYNDPSFPYFINGRQDPTSQRFEDLCPTNVTLPDSPPFDLNNIVIVGNGNCASTCATFTTLMFERHQTRIITFGGQPDLPIEYKGMAGMEVFEWADLDGEIKTAGLKDDPLAPPDLLVNANMRHNWRSSYSFLDENLPIAYVSEPSQFRFPYTADTYNNPQNLWTFVESQFFGS